ncbi:glycosyltransferase family 1 protein [Fictibacillus sp. UD]|uniref:glycosyltransferase family 1 protein n=1 Tax=Fictibacillus sp. UD TaxID=3038777 RepID=UPI00374587FC
MIKVLHCVNGMNRGGLETFIMNVYRNIDRSKIQFDFLVHTDKKCDFDDEIIALGGKIIKIPTRKYGFLANRKVLEEFFNEYKDYKIIHQHLSSLSYIVPLKTAKRHSVPVRIVHSHSTREGGSFLHNFIHKWNRVFINSYATHYFSCSDLASKWMFNKQVLNSNSYRIINNGIQTSIFSFNKEKRNMVRDNLGLDEKFVVGHVGRLTYPKNHEFLIDIFNEYLKTEPNSVLLLVGDGELRSQIEKKIKDLNLENKVILTGKRDDISELLQAMDVFIFPSHFEGLPVTLVEAQASGLPCIVSDNVTKQVKITDNIAYVKLDNTISTWIETIFEFKKRHIRRDRSEYIIKARFDIETIAQDLQDFYLNCSHSKM